MEFKQQKKKRIEIMRFMNIYCFVLHSQYLFFLTVVTVITKFPV